MIDSDVRWFHSGMANAPAMSGLAGTLIGVLDACLVNGFDPRALESLVVTDSVATATNSAGLAFEEHSVVRISGATPDTLNGDWRVASATATTFTFACAGIANVSATGTLSAKRSPVGWEKPFSDTNIAVYRATDLAATRLCLQVNDTETRYTRVRGYESMTSATAGTNEFPKLTRFAAGVPTWPRSGSTDATARPWAVIGDGKRFYVNLNWATTSSYCGELVFFGDILSVIVGDAFHCSLNFQEAASPSYPGHLNYLTKVPEITQYNGCLARAIDQLTFDKTMARLLAGTLTCGAYNYFGETNSDGGMSFIGPQLIAETTPAWRVRGVQPGLMNPLNGIPAYPWPLFRLVPGAGQLEGRQIAVVPSQTSSIRGQAGIDATGPWG